VSLSTKLKAIREGIKAVLAPLKEEVEANLVFGDRVRTSSLKPPAIWIFQDDSPISHAGSALAEEWTYNYVVAALVLNTDPEKGMEEAEDLAARATAALVADRTLSGAVRDTVRTRYLPGYATNVAKGPQLHWAAFAMESKFRHREE